MSVLDEVSSNIRDWTGKLVTNQHNWLVVSVVSLGQGSTGLSIVRIHCLAKTSEHITN
jgi:hypothetical protein